MMDLEKNGRVEKKGLWKFLKTSDMEGHLLEWVTSFNKDTSHSMHVTMGLRERFGVGIS